MQQIAIAVRDDDLFLLATVVRSTATDVYVNWSRDHVVEWKPHTSYHASGQHHQKSFGKALDVRKEQKPDVTFKGTRTVVSFGVATGEHTAVNVRCDPKDFSAGTSVLDLPDDLSSGVYLVGAEYSAGFLIYSAGLTTRPFARRFFEHTREYLTGIYTILDSAALVRGERKGVWHGLWYGEDTWRHSWAFLLRGRCDHRAGIGGSRRAVPPLEAMA